MSIRLYIGNLPKELDRDELAALFTAEVGELTSTKVVTDRKTGKCRGFGFVTVETDEQADQVIAKLNGHVFKDNALKIEKALPKSKEANNQGAGNNTPRRGNKNKSRSYTQAEAAQPDPRWADELEKLKEMLFAQTQS
ncbi:RNA-binding protein [Acaryochloris sp. CCMEE 5410]|uniref:RNA recognition motif domain-containing protein n=1 Tax=Acaryochloris sp. CCMEE 5410 TaxID=310037 RepID=UPI0002484BA3|nr:RNA-binding protein [Acaryochloris sp. CCMEE 5410]KAI9132957.1 RNA-binding protein [Acaryochloris sp. CCMEE 5410]